MKQVLIAVASLTLAGLGPLAVVAADERFPGIEKLMSEEEFRAAGLDKLSPAEREVLDRWLLRYTAGDAEVLLAEGVVVLHEHEGLRAGIAHQGRLRWLVRKHGIPPRKRAGVGAAPRWALFSPGISQPRSANRPELAGLLPPHRAGNG